MRRTGGSAREVNSLIRANRDNDFTTDPGAVVRYRCRVVWFVSTASGEDECSEQDDEGKKYVFLHVYLLVMRADVMLAENARFV